MKYVDANYLIRLFLWDIPELAEEAEQNLDACGHASVVVCEAVVEECCFVLTSARTYGFTHEKVREGLQKVLKKQCFAVDEGITQAIAMFGSHKKLDFVDCLLAVKAKGKAKNVLTFDAELQKVLK